MDNFIAITDKEANRIKLAISGIAYNKLGCDSYINKLRISAYKLFPKRIIDALENLKEVAQTTPYLVFDNVPIDTEITGSPAFNEQGTTFKSGCLSENIICAFGAIVGEPYSVAFEGRELVNNLTPQKGNKHDYTGQGSEVELDLHIENAALRYMGESDCSPSAMFLLGVRQDKDVINPKTYVVDAKKALYSLSKDDIAALYNKNFIIKVPYRWRDAFFGKENTDLVSMITGPMDKPRLSAAFYPDMVLPISERAKIAFTNLYNELKRTAIGIDIKPGRLVYINNKTALHSRDKFIPTYDQNACPYRWIQRIFITSSLWNFREFPLLGDRVFNPSVT